MVVIDPEVLPYYSPAEESHLVQLEDYVVLITAHLSLPVRGERGDKE